MTPREALMAAIDVLGSQKAVAAAAGADVETGHVYYWLNKANEVPARYCPGIERETREKGTPIFCEWLCPSADWKAVRRQSGPPPTASAEHAAAVEAVRIFYGATERPLPNGSDRPSKPRSERR
jgi:DNA-binding transcriptional regulator YdaS (Cro superfamily)